MAILKQFPGFESLQLNYETPLSFFDFNIYFDRRKVYYKQQEIKLTTKEYDLLCLLVANKGRVLTYEQIYQKVWNEEPLGNENNAIGCHIRNLREKLYEVLPNAPFEIKCVREIGYCFEIKSE
ncbi:winged helix-turn-helix domain-containing protein [Ruminococcus sp.]|uniref:winged helix-turn-helix domain-containing protein n=1 Tax=Ruminococcus sp. TaxID=41978 RepID=UPI003F1285BE